MSLLAFVLLFLQQPNTYSQADSYRLSVVVSELENGQALEGAEVSITPCSCGGVTNTRGSYSIELKPDTYTVEVFFIGYQAASRKVELSADRSIEIGLSIQEEQLSEVVVRAKNISESLESPQMGIVQINAETLEKVPAGPGGVGCPQGYGACCWGK